MLREQIKNILSMTTGTLYLTDQILTLFKEQIDKLEVIGGEKEQIILSNYCDTYDEPDGSLLALIKLSTQAQLTHDKTKLYEVLE